MYSESKSTYNSIYFQLLCRVKKVLDPTRLGILQGEYNGNIYYYWWKDEKTISNSKQRITNFVDMLILFPGCLRF